MADSLFEKDTALLNRQVQNQQAAERNLGRVPLSQIRKEFLAAGIEWTPEVEADVMANEPVYNDLPSLPGQMASSFLSGTTAGMVGEAWPGLPNDVARLTGMLGTAGRVGAATKIGKAIGGAGIRAVIGRALESGAGLGIYSGVESGAHGGDVGDIAGATGMGFGTGMVLGGLHAAPGIGGFLKTLPGEAALWGGLTKISDPEASVEDASRGALAGIIASRLARFGGGRSRPWRVVEEARPLEQPVPPERPTLQRFLEQPKRETAPINRDQEMAKWDEVIAKSEPLAKTPAQQELKFVEPADAAPPRVETPERRVSTEPWSGAERRKSMLDTSGEAARPKRSPEGDRLAAEARAWADQQLTGVPPLEPYAAPDTRAIAAEVGLESLRAGGIIPPETTPAKRTPAQRKAEIAKIAARKKAELEQTVIQEPVAPVDPLQAERDAAVAEFLAKQEAPGSPMANVQAGAGPITQEATPKRHKRTGRVLEPAAKAEPAAPTEYEHLIYRDAPGNDYLNKKTGEVFTRVLKPNGEVVYLPTSAEYAARAKQKAAGIGKTQTMSAPVDRDVTLGSGLGAAQGAIGVASKGVLNKIAPQGLPPRQVQTDIPASVAANRFLTTGDVYELYRLTNAIRDHKPSPEFIARIPEMGKISQPGFSPRTEIIQGVTGGRIANKEQLETLGVLEDLHLAELELRGQLLEVVEKTMATGPAGEKIKPRSKVDIAAASISEHVSTKDVALSDAELMSRPEIGTILGKLSPADRALALNMARCGREFYDNTIQIQNIVLEGLNGELIPYRDNYLPHMEEVGFLAGLTQDAPARTGYQKESKRFRPSHTRHRTGDMENRKESMLEIAELYSQAAAQVVGNNMAIAHMRSYVAALRKAGKNDAADQLQRMIDVQYGGKADRVTEFVDREVSGAVVPTTVRRVGHLLSEMASDAQLGLNLGFVLGTMPTSIAFVDVSAGPRASVAAKMLMSNPVVRSWVKSVSYAYTIKTGGGEGSVVNQDIVGGRGKYRNRGHRAIRHEIRHWFSLATQRMETELSMYSFLAGYSKAKLAGATEAQAIALGDNYIKEFQVMLDRANSSEVSMSRDTNLFAKYNRFPIQMYNNIRKRFGIGLGRTGAYRDPEFRIDPNKWDKSHRAMFAALAATVLFLQDQYYRQMTGRSLYGASSAIPFAAPLGLGEEYGKYSNLPFIAQQGRMVSDAVLSTGDLIEKGDYSKYLKYLWSNILPGGSPTSRWMAGDKADRESGWWPENAPGYPIDSSGFATYDPTIMTLPFVGRVDLPGEANLQNLLLPKKLQMRLFGPHSTKEGQEYWAEKERRRR